MSNELSGKCIPRKLVSNSLFEYSGWRTTVPSFMYTGSFRAAWITSTVGIGLAQGRISLEAWAWSFGADEE